MGNTQLKFYKIETDKENGNLVTEYPCYNSTNYNRSLLFRPLQNCDPTGYRSFPGVLRQTSPCGVLRPTSPCGVLRPTSPYGVLRRPTSPYFSAKNTLRCNCCDDVQNHATDSLNNCIGTKPIQDHNCSPSPSSLKNNETSVPNDRSHGANTPSSENSIHEPSENEAQQSPSPSLLTNNETSIPKDLNVQKTSVPAEPVGSSPVNETKPSKIPTSQTNDENSVSNNQPKTKIDQIPTTVVPTKTPTIQKGQPAQKPSKLNLLTTPAPALDLKNLADATDSPQSSDFSNSNTNNTNTIRRNPSSMNTQVPTKVSSVNLQANPQSKKSFENSKSSNVAIPVIPKPVKSTTDAIPVPTKTSSLNKKVDQNSQSTPVSSNSMINSVQSRPSLLKNQAIPVLKTISKPSAKRIPSLLHSGTSIQNVAVIPITETSTNLPTEEPKISANPSKLKKTASSVPKAKSIPKVNEIQSLSEQTVIPTSNVDGAQPSNKPSILKNNETSSLKTSSHLKKLDENAEIPAFEKPSSLKNYQNTVPKESSNQIIEQISSPVKQSDTAIIKELPDNSQYIKERKTSWKPSLLKNSMSSVPKESSLPSVDVIASPSGATKAGVSNIEDVEPSRSPSVLKNKVSSAQKAPSIPNVNEIDSPSKETDPSVAKIGEAQPSRSPSVLKNKVSSAQKTPSIPNVNEIDSPSKETDPSVAKIGEAQPSRSPSVLKNKVSSAQKAPSIPNVNEIDSPRNETGPSVAKIGEAQPSRSPTVLKNKVSSAQKAPSNSNVNKIGAPSKETDPSVAKIGEAQPSRSPSVLNNKVSRTQKPPSIPNVNEIDSPSRETYPSVTKIGESRPSGSPSVLKNKVSTAQKPPSIPNVNKIDSPSRETDPSVSKIGEPQLSKKPSSLKKKDNSVSEKPSDLLEFDENDEIYVSEKPSALKNNAISVPQEPSPSATEQIPYPEEPVKRINGKIKPSRNISSLKTNGISGTVNPSELEFDENDEIEESEKPSSLKMLANSSTQTDLPNFNKIPNSLKSSDFSKGDTIPIPQNAASVNTQIPSKVSSVKLNAHSEINKPFDYSSSSNLVTPVLPKRIKSKAIASPVRTKTTKSKAKTALGLPKPIKSITKTPLVIPEPIKSKTTKPVPVLKQSSSEKTKAKPILKKWPSSTRVVGTKPSSSNSFKAIRSTSIGKAKSGRSKSPVQRSVSASQLTATRPAPGSKSKPTRSVSFKYMKPSSSPSSGLHYPEKLNRPNSTNATTSNAGKPNKTTPKKTKSVHFIADPTLKKLNSYYELEDKRRRMTMFRFSPPDIPLVPHFQRFSTYEILKNKPRPKGYIPPSSRSKPKPNNAPSEDRPRTSNSRPPSTSISKPSPNAVTIPKKVSLNNNYKRTSAKPNNNAPLNQNTTSSKSTPTTGNPKKPMTANSVASDPPKNKTPTQENKPRSKLRDSMDLPPPPFPFKEIPYHPVHLKHTYYEPPPSVIKKTLTRRNTTDGNNLRRKSPSKHQSLPTSTAAKILNKPVATRNPQEGAMELSRKLAEDQQWEYQNSETVVFFHPVGQGGAAAGEAVITHPKQATAVTTSTGATQTTLRPPTPKSQSPGKRLSLGKNDIDLKKNNNTKQKVSFSSPIHNTPIVVQQFVVVQNDKKLLNNLRSEYETYIGNYEKHITAKRNSESRPNLTKPTNKIIPPECNPNPQHGHNWGIPTQSNPTELLHKADTSSSCDESCEGSLASSHSIDVDKCSQATNSSEVANRIISDCNPTPKCEQCKFHVCKFEQENDFTFPFHSNLDDILAKLDKHTNKDKMMTEIDENNNFDIDVDTISEEFDYVTLSLINPSFVDTDKDDEAVFALLRNFSPEEEFCPRAIPPLPNINLDLDITPSTSMTENSLFQSVQVNIRNNDDEEVHNESETDLYFNKIMDRTKMLLDGSSSIVLEETTNDDVQSTISSSYSINSISIHSVTALSQMSSISFSDNDRAVRSPIRESDYDGDIEGDEGNLDFQFQTKLRRNDTEDVTQGYRNQTKRNRVLSPVGSCSEGQESDEDTVGYRALMDKYKPETLSKSSREYIGPLDNFLLEINNTSDYDERNWTSGAMNRSSDNNGSIGTSMGQMHSSDDSLLPGNHQLSGSNSSPATSSRYDYLIPPGNQNDTITSSSETLNGQSLNASSGFTSDQSEICSRPGTLISVLKKSTGYSNKVSGENKYKLDKVKLTRSVHFDIPPTP